jgi:hypothetical protein
LIGWVVIGDWWLLGWLLGSLHAGAWVMVDGKFVGLRQQCSYAGGDIHDKGFRG